MHTLTRFLWLALLGAVPAQAQFLDCSCLSTQTVLVTNACQAVVPDLCLFTNCWVSTVVPPPTLTCSQTPAPGTPVGPGTYSILVTVMDTSGVASQCPVKFIVNPANCVFSLICASNKTVECGSSWTFDPPTWANACSPPPGTPSNGVVLTIVSTVTNGTCPMIITQTWLGTDDCGNHDQCSQTVTVVDTTAPVLDCNCLRNPAVVPLSVTACASTIPDLCKFALSCATDACGPLTCSQSPAAGTAVGPGTYPITVGVTDCAGNPASCTVVYVVTAPPGGCVTNACPTNVTVWNSGMGGPNGSVPLAPGTPDPNFTLVSAPPSGCNGPAQVLQAASLPVPPWVANGPNSQWIGASPSAACQGGVYHYRLCFDLVCTDGASIVGQWSADDNAEVLLNGQPTGMAIPAQYPNLPLYGWYPFSLTNGFICGVNCLDFYVTNALGGMNPTGLRAELTNTFNECCCTATQTLFSVNTGVDANGPMPQGAPDPQLALTCVPPGVAVTTPVVTQPSPFWLANGPSSQWVGPFAPLNNYPDGVYCYTLTFNIPCPAGVPIRASVTGRWTADDTGTIYLNGVPTGNSLPNGWAFTNWQAINFTSGFVPGANTLTFYVTNGLGSPSPTGIRLELTGSASCCDCAGSNCVVSITCPTNQSVEVCTPNTPVTYPTPTATSTCAQITNIVCTPPSGSVFPLGTNTVTCTAYDALGHTNACTFLVRVRSDRTPPTCPPFSLSVTGCPPVMPDFSTNGLVTDNCTPVGQIQVTQSIPPGTPITTSPTIVILNLCDNAGNCRVCDVSLTPVLSPSCCTPVPVLRLFSGATNSPAGVLPGGALDPQFLTGLPLFPAPNPYVLPWINSWWIPNSAASKWVGPSLTSVSWPGGVYYHTNRFFLCSTNQARITGRWTADDTGRIWLNGAPTANVLPNGWAFTNWHPVTITAGFLPGWNTLVFAVTNGGYSPTGLRTEITGSACCSQCLALTCAPPISTNVCGKSAVVTYPLPAVNSSCAPLSSVTCVPPSGATFPAGTTAVNCTAIDTLGNAAYCSFTVTVVRTGAPPVIVCPPNQTISTCTASAVAWYKVKTGPGMGPVLCTPPSGSVFPLGTTTVTCSAVGPCGDIASCSFQVVVKHMPPHFWPCPWPPIGIGLPHLGVGTNIARVAVTPLVDLPAFGPVGDEPALAILPDPLDPAQTAATEIRLGGGQAFSFTTVLDMNAPEDARIVVSVPTSDGTNAPVLAIVKGKCPPRCNWDIKPAKKFFDDGGSACRVSAVNTNGDLLDAFTVTAAEAEGESLLSLVSEPGVDQFPISFLFDATTGEITVMFPGSAARRLCNGLPCPRGWDGTIKGRIAEEGARRKGWDGTIKCPCYDDNASRVVFTPVANHPPPTLTSLEISSAGLPELVLTAEQLIIGGETNRPIRVKTLGPGSNADAWAVSFQGTAEADGLNLAALGDLGGVSLDLGYAAAFDSLIHHFENGDVPTQEQLFRIGGPRWPIALTNRPAPPPIEVRLVQAPDGVECYLDFSWLDPMSVTVRLLNDGAVVGEATGDGNVLSILPLVLSDWPERFGLVGPADGFRFTRSQPFTVSGLTGNELRVIPHLAPETLVPTAFSQLDCVGSAGLESIIRDLRITSACAPSPLHVQRGADGLRITWEGDTFRLLGAETVKGPWMELGVGSPVILGPAHPARYFRLVCQ